ncbi:Spo0E family sporulation regulatory protein-aspartic acid phosphatase [Mangrovibacillus cuniculi]|uniref:Spo0E family sporulation regulatory protein-aspartic acid phosphatase n=1 Tax=Mangrovibacillus cuniculi TaxID=2593652 RepID=A0A7S8HG98_9BACI|nr:Spo0E family sporulation regulatory protein-aspartic acid phosphatase [Mangrovibacillus cuniculi]QPC47678.1 Spo0E family sporulation regulatory protein-aspartic acid phosphatase [Mangrovibacillus cuniculi]
MVCIHEAFEMRRQKLLSFGEYNLHNLSSEEIVELSQQVDHFITLFQHNKCDELTIEWSEDPDSLVLYLKGELSDKSICSLSFVYEMLLPIFHLKKQVIVCAHSLTYIDSLGVQALINLANSCLEHETRLEFHLFPNYMHNVLKMIGFYGAIEENLTKNDSYIH